MNHNAIPVLRVGIISDVQGYAYSQDWGMHNLEKALKMLEKKNIDVLIMAGDLADYGDDAAPIAYYQDRVKEIFRGKMPVHAACAGNHDFWTHYKKSQEQCFHDFCDALEEPYDNPLLKTINGYDFIMFSSYNTSNYSAEDCEKLRPVLDRCVARDPEKPIFVITHKQPLNTVTGSFLKGDASEALRKVLNDYPQVVSISGHSHRPLEDERCIWQQEFTAINTSTLSYGCVENDPVNVIGAIVPYAREVVQMEYMEVFPDRLEIHRYNVEDEREIKADKLWTVPLPYSPENPVYSNEQRAAQRSAPKFRPDTQIYVRHDFGFTFLIFEGAEHEDFTHFYKICITPLTDDEKQEETMEFLYLSNFYRLQRNQDPRQVFKMPPNSLKPGKRYRFEVYPVESFGNTGDPITLEAAISPTYFYQNVEDVFPQE